MATFNKFEDFVEQLGLAKHQLHTDVLKVYLSNEAPIATDTVLPPRPLRVTRRPRRHYRFGR